MIISRIRFLPKRTKRHARTQVGGSSNFSDDVLA
jgi:hypothetical protein